MLIECTVTRWNGWPNKERECILNTTRMSKVIDVTGGSKLLYSYLEGHRRGNLHPIEIDKTAEEINTASEIIPDDNFHAFRVFPDDDLDATPTLINFKVRDIARIVGYLESKWVSACWMWIHHNEVRLERYLVFGSFDFMVDEILEDLN